MAKRGTRKPKADPKAETYDHKGAESLLRPEIGLQAQFKQKKAPAKYQYDPTLDPALCWDGQNPAREQGEALIREVLEAKTIEQAKAAGAKLKAISKPFLNWAGKAERLSFDVATLPLFVHERLSTKAILETLKGHARDKQMQMLFADPDLSITDRILKAYEHKDRWVNRMVLGDSLVVMNSLLHYEGLGGQVQMIYMDPPYGVKFGSNFQPFVRKRDVKHNDDQDMTREPEMVQAYRDTWELGLHSYLTYLRDRLLLCRELLHPSGSIFVQIGDENLHHVREVLDEIMGAEHFCGVICFAKTSGFAGTLLSSTADYLLWYARDKERVKYRQLFWDKKAGSDEAEEYNRAELPDAIRRTLTKEERQNPAEVTAAGGRLYRQDNIISVGWSEVGSFHFEFEDRQYNPGPNSHWKTTHEGMTRLASLRRLEPRGSQLSYVRFLDDFPALRISNRWDDTAMSSRAEEKHYVVQTSTKVIERCILMTTDPGDLVLDPTCGSGTSAYVAEQWGRRWITIDTSRVPLALARQRLLTATFPYYELKDAAKGPAGGFVYKRKQNSKGEEVGGIVPHVTLKSIANNEPPDEEVLVDRPETESGITRVSGPLVVEATIPTPVDFDADGVEDSQTKTSEQYADFTQRMLEVLRKAPVLRLPGNKTVTFKNVRQPAKTLSLSAEALVDATAPGQSPTLQDAVREATEKNGKALPLSAKPVAFVFGPENGAVSEKLVFQAAKEANGKGYSHLYVLGFAIQPNAREMVENCAEAVGVPATYVQATPDIAMGDLLKNQRSSQVFSVCALPEVKLVRLKQKGGNGELLYRAELLGLDSYNPVDGTVDPRDADDVPCWMLDTDYNELCFHAGQVFFPRTSAWDNLKRALKGTYEDSVWEHLAGTVSEPFPAPTGENKQIAVKVIDDRGNELMVVKKLDEAESEE